MDLLSLGITLITNGLHNHIIIYADKMVRGVNTETMVATTMTYGKRKSEENRKKNVLVINFFHIQCI